MLKKLFLFGFICTLHIFNGIVHAKTDDLIRYDLKTTEEIKPAQYSEALQFAQRQLTDLLSLEVNALPQLTVVITKTSEEREQYPTDGLTKPFLLLSEDLLLQKQDDRVSLADVVAHEACHLWLISAAEQHGLLQQKQMIPNYGHSAFNDWFDEMTAVSCEGEGLQQLRTEQSFELIPLTQYLTQQHPVYAQIQAQIKAAMAARQSKNKDSQTVIKMTLDEPDFGRYYRQSALFYKFLQSHQYPLSVGEWFAVAQEKSAEKQAKGLGYPSVSELEQAFLKYLDW